MSPLVRLLVVLVVVIWPKEGVGIAAQCVENEVTADLQHCARFNWCGEKDAVYNFACEKGLFFNEEKRKCDVPQNVDCSNRGGYSGMASNESLTYQKGTYWGPELPKDLCKRVFCTIVFRSQDKQFTAGSVDPRLCSHIIVANFRLSGSEGVEVISVDQGEETPGAGKAWVLEQIAKIRLISEVYTDVKVLASVGHLDTSAEIFSLMRKKREREKFVSGAAHLLRQLKLNGLHLHWMAPADPSRTIARDLSYFVREIAVAFDRDAMVTNLPRLTFGLSIPADEAQINAGFVASSISRADTVFLMTQSMSVNWKVSDGGAPIRVPAGREWTVDQAVRKWQSLSVVTQNIVLGVSLATYRHYVTSHDDATDVSFPKSYSDTCSNARGPRAIDMAYGPGYTLGTFEADASSSYVDATEDELSLAEKASFVASYNLGGIHLVDLNNDDFLGQCKKSTSGKWYVKYPLAMSVVEACAVTPDPVNSNASKPASCSTPHVINRNAKGCNTLVCMFQNRFPGGKPSTQLHVQDIDPTYCTHLAYANVKITSNDEDGSAVHLQPEDSDIRILRQLVSLKADYPNLQVLVVARDPYRDQNHIEHMANTYSEVRRFILQAMWLLRDLNLDGIDIDWYFPKQRNGSGFYQLMQNFSALFNRESDVSGRPRLTLSTAVYGNVMEFYVGLDKVSEAVDILRFDISFQHFLLRGERVSGLNATTEYLLRQPDVSKAVAELNTNNVRRDRVVLSLTTEAKVFEYFINNNNMAVLTKAQKLPETQTYGRGAYYEVCRLRMNAAATEYIDLQRGAHYILYYHNDTKYLILFQDETILRKKIGVLLDQGFAGGFVQNLAGDDFTGEYCNQGVFPLLTAIGSGCSDFKGRPQATAVPTSFTGRQLASVPSVGCTRVVCYYNNEARQRPGDGQMFPRDIDPTPCTHLIFSHAFLKTKTITPAYPDDIGRNFAYSQFAALKERNQNVNTLLSVRNPPLDQGRQMLKLVISGAQEIESFARQSAQYLRQHGFNGLEIDWHDPPATVGKREKAGFSLLVRTLATVFKEDAQNPLLVAVKLSGRRDVIRALYDLPDISESADMLLANTYSWYDWQTNVYHYSPVFQRTLGAYTDKENAQNTLDSLTSYLLGQGVPADKLVIGIGFYGHSYVLSKPNFFQAGDESKSVGPKANFTQQFGTLASYEACDLKARGGKTYFIDEQLVPYMVYEDQWIGFENDVSVRQKVRFAKMYGLIGVSVWSVDADDFKGKFCGADPFPLLSTVRKECSVIGQEAAKLIKATDTPALFEARFDMKRVCYVNLKSLVRHLPGQFDPMYIPPGLCSHIILNTITFQDDGSISGLAAPTLNAIRTMKLLKGEDDNLRVLLSIRAAKKDGFSTVARSEEKTQRLFRSLNTLLRSQRVYGVDLQMFGANNEDAAMYTEFITKLKAYLDKNSAPFGTNATLSVAVSSEPQSDLDYKAISSKVDFINVFSFHYTDGWDNLKHDSLTEDFQHTINEYVKVGVPKDKLVAGISLYGKIYYLTDPSVHNVSDPADKGPKGVSTKVQGRWAYYEICDLLMSDDHTGIKISGYTNGGPQPGQSSAYYNSKIWVSYDSRNKVQEKVAWLKNQKLAGYLLYTLDADVFLQGLCGFNIEAFPIAMGAHLASREMKQFQAQVQSAATSLSPGFGYQTAWNIQQWLGIKGSAIHTLMMSAALETVYYTVVIMQSRN